MIVLNVWSLSTLRVHGPWKCTGSDAFLLFRWNRTISRWAGCPIQSCALSKETVGKECLSWEGLNYTWVRETKCRRALVYNDPYKKFPWCPGAPTWYWAPQKGGNGNHTCIPFNSTSGILEQNCTGNQPDTNPFLAIPGISPHWKPLLHKPRLIATLRGTFWNCGRRAYSGLPCRYGRTCTIGIIQSGFFLLPTPGDMLVFPICDNLRHREKWFLELGGKQN